jgi:beta-glucosidase
MNFMFATGIENSIPLIKNGTHRVDQYALCKHYDHWRQDFELLKDMGITHLRYGTPLHTTWTGADRFDWSFADEKFSALSEKGIVPIMDLCHFGLPDWLGDFQNPDFPKLFGEYAGAFAQRYPWVQHYTPVNEMLICATFSARNGWWNEQKSDDKSFVTALKHLCKANVLAMQKIVEVRPDAIFIQAESIEYASPDSFAAWDAARLKNSLRFVTLDLNYQRTVNALVYQFLLDGGMTREEYDWFYHQPSVKKNCILGMDYYITSEHYINEQGGLRAAGDVLGLSEVTRHYYQRYNLPVMHTETNMNADHGDAVAWLHRQWSNIVHLMCSGVPVKGFTWYSLNHQCDWDTALREANGNVNAVGLFDLDRNIMPVGDAYKKLITDFSERY